MLYFKGQESVYGTMERSPSFVPVLTGPSFCEDIDACSLLDEPLDHSVVVAWEEGGREGGREEGRVNYDGFLLCGDIDPCSLLDEPLDHPVLVAWREGGREGGRGGK